MFTVGINQRFRPDVQRVRALVASGSLGNVYYTKACLLSAAPGIRSSGPGSARRASRAAARLLDIGVQMLDLALQ